MIHKLNYFKQRGVEDFNILYNKPGKINPVYRFLFYPRLEETIEMMRNALNLFPHV